MSLTDKAGDKISGVTEQLLCHSSKELIRGYTAPEGKMSEEIVTRTDEEHPVAPSMPPPEIWAVYCGDINANNTAKLMSSLTVLGVQGVKRLHLLFQSWGGFVGDGVFLYNALKCQPVEVILYNAGQVASAATLVFLGAHGRKTTTNAVFMIHKGSTSANGAGAERLKAAAGMIDTDDARIERILRTHLRLPEELWTQFAYHDVFLSGEDAVTFGMADAVAEFSPPVGVSVLNALG